MHEDIKSLDRAQLAEVISLVLKNTVVVFKDQNLTTDEEIAICDKIGKTKSTARQAAKYPGGTLNDAISRISGELDGNGQPGMFPQTAEIKWHIDGVQGPEQGQLHWLYSIKGTQNSCTSWINTSLVYESLSTEWKNWLKAHQVNFGWKDGVVLESESNSLFVYKKPASLVYTNEENTTGLFFPIYQVFGIENETEEVFNTVYKYLKEQILKDEFVYHHYWEDGDLVISEHWLTLHKRWAFDHISKRELHRIALDYSKIYLKDL